MEQPKVRSEFTLFVKVIPLYRDWFNRDFILNEKDVPELLKEEWSRWLSAPT